MKIKNDRDFNNKFYRPSLRTVRIGNVFTA